MLAERAAGGLPGQRHAGDLGIPPPHPRRCRCGKTDYSPAAKKPKMEAAQSLTLFFLRPANSWPSLPFGPGCRDPYKDMTFAIPERAVLLRYDRWSLLTVACIDRPGSQSKMIPNRKFCDFVICRDLMNPTPSFFLATLSFEFDQKIGEEY